MTLHERAEAVADRVMALGDRDFIVSVVEGALESAINEADAAHVKLTRTADQIRIEIDTAVRPEAALLLMAEAQELIRVRVIAEMVHGRGPLIAAPNGAGASMGGAVQFRVGRVGEAKQP